MPGNILSKEVSMYYNDMTAKQFIKQSMAVSRNLTRAIVGKVVIDRVANTKRGTVYIYVKSNNLWVLEKEIKMTPTLNNTCGNRVGISEDGKTICFTDTEYLSGASGSTTGTIYFYKFLDTGGWTYDKMIPPNNVHLNGILGNNASLVNNGNTIVLSLTNYTDDTANVDAVIDVLKYQAGEWIADSFENDIVGTIQTNIHSICATVDGTRIAACGSYWVTEDNITDFIYIFIQDELGKYTLEYSIPLDEITKVDQLTGSTIAITGDGQKIVLLTNTINVDEFKDTVSLFTRRLDNTGNIIWKLADTVEPVKDLNKNENLISLTISFDGTRVAIGSNQRLDNPTDGPTGILHLYNITNGAFVYSTKYTDMFAKTPQQLIQVLSAT